MSRWIRWSSLSIQNHFGFKCGYVVVVVFLSLSCLLFNVYCNFSLFMSLSFFVFESKSFSNEQTKFALGPSLCLIISLLLDQEMEQIIM